MEQHIAQPRPAAVPPDRRGIAFAVALGGVVGAPACFGLTLFAFFSSGGGPTMVLAFGIPLAAVAAGVIRFRRDNGQAAFFATSGLLTGAALAYLAWMLSTMTFSF
jgi:hypothetical protein